MNPFTEIELAELAANGIVPRSFTVGQAVICNGYPGRVIEVIPGRFGGLIVVRLGSGNTCVSPRDVLTVQTVEAR